MVNTVKKPGLYRSRLVVRDFASDYATGEPGTLYQGACALPSSDIAREINAINPISRKKIPYLRTSKVVTYDHSHHRWTARGGTTLVEGI